MKRFSTNQEFEICDYIYQKFMSNNPEADEDTVNTIINDSICQLTEELVNS